MVSSPLLAKRESVVLIVARPSPVAAAISPAVIASPADSVCRTARLVAPGALRVALPAAPADLPARGLRWLDELARTGFCARVPER